MDFAFNRRNWLVYLLLLTVCVVMAQRMIAFRKISVNDGLSQSTISSMIQDSRGYMWFGTDDGLSRYDGYNFKVFRPEVGNPYSISGQRIGIISEDDAQCIWVATAESLERYDPRTGRFIHYIHDEKDTTTLVKATVSSIHFGDSGLVWIGTKSGLEILNPVSGKVTHLRHDENNVHSIPSDNVTGLASVKNGILVGTDSGTCVMNPTSYEVTNFVTAPFSVCTRIIEDNVRRIIVCGDTGLYLYNEERMNFTVLANGRQMGPRGEYGPGVITALEQDPNGICWSGGWMRLAPIEISDTGISHIVYYSNGVWPTGSSAICVDSGMNAWAGGEGSELLTGNIRSSRFLSYRMLAPGQAPQFINPVWSCSEDKEGNFVITSQGSIHKVNPRTGESVVYQHDDSNPKSIPYNHGAFAGLCDSKGRVWIDCGPNLCLREGETDNWKVYTTAKGDSTTHPPRNTACLYETRDGSIWLGTYGYAMVRFDPATEKFRPYRQPKGSQFAPSHAVIRSIFEDEAGTMWIGTSRGLDQFDPLEGKYYPKFLDTKYANEIYGIEQAEPGMLWMGSNVYGLLKYDIALNKVVAEYTDADGLANNCVYDIVKDNDGILWISTNKGISRFDPVTEKFRNYDHSDGLQHNEFSGGAGTLTPSGWILFGCADGFTAFRPDHMQDNPFPPKVLITRLQLYNRDVIISPDKEQLPDSSVFRIEQTGDTASLPIDISFVQNLELNYDQNFLSFDFVAMHYASPEKNAYAYMMEGLEDNWNEVGTRRNASYTNLAPGEYTFRVKASNCDGVWNDTGKSIHIIINPPWWETWWFRSSGILFLIGSVWAFFQYRTANLRRRQKELEQTVTERTEEVLLQKEVITLQKHMVEEKQKEIIDSITYAQRIQRALLASDKLLNENLGEYFVLFRPKDIVAGDFYWGTPSKDGFLLITADCTGHGVPGAFMSLLNISKLSETISEKKITRPDLILNNVRTEIIRSLNPNPLTDNSQDGMDCILCKFDFKNYKLEYAAANNSFYIVRNNQLIDCVADKMPVGKSHDDTKPFTLHTVSLEPGDVVYTLTDGYPDQFGGPKGKKYKYKQLEEFLLQIANEPIAIQKEKLLTSIEEWRGNLEQVDDICIIGIKIP